MIKDPHQSNAAVSAFWAGIAVYLEYLLALPFFAMVLRTAQQQAYWTGRGASSRDGISDIIDSAAAGVTTVISGITGDVTPDKQAAYQHQLQVIQADLDKARLLNVQTVVSTAPTSILSIAFGIGAISIFLGCLIYEAICLIKGDMMGFKEVLTLHVSLIFGSSMTSLLKPKNSADVPNVKIGG